MLATVQDADLRFLTNLCSEWALSVVSAAQGIEPATQLRCLRVIFPHAYGVVLVLMTFRRTKLTKRDWRPYGERGAPLPHASSRVE